MTLRVQYALATSAQKEVCEDLVARFGVVVLPKWVSDLTVRYTGDSDVNAQVYDEYEYRRVQIELGASFFAQEDDEMSRDFVHELCHALQSPLTTFITGLGTGFFGKGRQGEALKDLYTKALESANEDTAEVIWSVLNTTPSGDATGFDK